MLDEVVRSIDWTTVLLAGMAYGAGMWRMWLRVRSDVELGRSLRPKAPRGRPVPSSIPPG